MNFGAAVSWNALLFTPQAGYTGKVHLIDPYTGAQTDISSPSQTSVITTLDAQGQLTLTDVTTRGTRYYSSGKKVTGEKGDREKGDRFIFPPIRGKVSQDDQGGFVCQGWDELSCRDTRITLSSAATTAKWCLSRLKITTVT